jgi:hypothetical protein
LNLICAEGKKSPREELDLKRDLARFTYSNSGGRQNSKKVSGKGNFITQRYERKTTKLGKRLNSKVGSLNQYDGTE